VAGALIVLPRAVDHDRDTAEILQAADIDHGRRIVAALLDVTPAHCRKCPTAGSAAGPGSAPASPNSPAPGRRSHVLSVLLATAVMVVERLHRHRADLRASVQDRRRGHPLLGRLCRLAFGLLRSFMAGRVGRDQQRKD